MALSEGVRFRAGASQFGISRGMTLLSRARRHPVPAPSRVLDVLGCSSDRASDLASLAAMTDLRRTNQPTTINIGAWRFEHDGASLSVDVHHRDRDERVDVIPDASRKASTGDTIVGGWTVSEAAREWLQHHEQEYAEQGLLRIPGDRLPLPVSMGGLEAPWRDVVDAYVRHQRISLKEAWERIAQETGNSPRGIQLRYYSRPDRPWYVTS
jgi:hypothetical protein